MSEFELTKRVVCDCEWFSFIIEFIYDCIYYVAVLFVSISRRVSFVTSNRSFLEGKAEKIAVSSVELDAGKLRKSRTFKISKK